MCEHQNNDLKRCSQSSENEIEQQESRPVKMDDTSIKI